jgi:hypothetical protein
MAFNDLKVACPDAGASRSSGGIVGRTLNSAGGHRLHEAFGKRHEFSMPMPREEKVRGLPDCLPIRRRVPRQLVLHRARWTGGSRIAMVRSAVDFLNANYLFASLIWGTVGLGYFMFGKKQQSFIPMIGGIVMMVVSFIVSSALAMSLICVAVGVAVYLLLREGL